jgi:hypothetical protein
VAAKFKKFKTTLCIPLWVERCACPISAQQRADRGEIEFDTGVKPNAA